MCLLAMNSLYSSNHEKKKGAKPGVIEPGTYSVRYEDNRNDLTDGQTDLYRRWNKPVSKKECDQFPRIQRNLSKDFKRNLPGGLEQSCQGFGAIFPGIKGNLFSDFKRNLLRNLASSFEGFRVICSVRIKAFSVSDNLTYTWSTHLPGSLP